MSERYFIHAYDQTVSNIIDEVVEETYKAFSESVGVENIRKYEENEQASQKLAEESLSLRNQQSKLKYQFYEEKRDMGAHIAKLESSLNELKMAMCKVDMIEKELKSTIGKASQEIDTIRKEVQALAKVYDFGELRRSQKKNMRPAEREKLKAEFKQKIEILISKIDRTVSNLKAIDQYVALKEKERAASKEYHNARNELNKISEQFETMRTKRFNGLMDPALVGLGCEATLGQRDVWYEFIDEDGEKNATEEEAWQLAVIRETFMKGISLNVLEGLSLTWRAQGSILLVETKPRLLSAVATEQQKNGRGVILCPPSANIIMARGEYASCETDLLE
ncbi:structural maintenance of chromosomes protein 1 [Tanacetum coccineum]